MIPKHCIIRRLLRFHIHQKFNLFFGQICTEPDIIINHSLARNIILCGGSADTPCARQSGVHRL